MFYHPYKETNKRMYISGQIIGNMSIDTQHLNGPPNNKIACIYAYYEKDEKYKENLRFFLEHGGVVDEIDYYLVINGDCSLDLSAQTAAKNIQVLRRENNGFDFGAYSYAIQAAIREKYDYYFFMNTSVRGPYLRSSDHTKKWYEYFLELFNSPHICLVGTSINIHNALGDRRPDTHVQSMFFCMNAAYFELLKLGGFFDEKIINEMKFEEVICKCEVILSQFALQRGYGINCILPGYRDLDYLVLKENINPSSRPYNGCPYHEGAYFGKNIDPFDVVFFKNNRF